MAVFLKESDGIIKMSFRSIGSIPVNEMASKDFSGGGHLNASGGKFVGSLENAIAKLVTILPKFVEDYKNHFE
jgi:phosphoesterase RecJ-like protein